MSLSAVFRRGGAAAQLLARASEKKPSASSSSSGSGKPAAAKPPPPAASSTEDDDEGPGPTLPTVQVRVNVFKSNMAKDLDFLHVNKAGSAPVFKPDDQYPDWIWNLGDPTRPLIWYQDKDILALPPHERRRFFKKLNRKRIKEQNEIAATGQVF